MRRRGETGHEGLRAWGRRGPGKGPRVLRVLVATVLGILALGAASRSFSTTFQFSRWNGTWPDLVGDLAPVENGPVELDLSSPSNVVRLRDHRLELTPLGDGTHRALLEVELQAGGRLEGVLRLGSLARPVEDRVVVPPQRLSIPARIRLVPSLEGFEVTPVELPNTLTVRVQSRLANELLGICEQLSVLVVAADCSGLSVAADRVTVDLPPAGDTYLLPRELVTPEERTALLRYLEASEELGR